MTANRPLLIVGVPRSGTSWIGRIVECANGIIYVHEPDNEKRDPFALRAKADLGRFPILDESDEHRAYEALWRGAFEGGMVASGLRDRWAGSLFGGSTQDDLESAVGSGRMRPRLQIASRLATHRRRPAETGRVVVKSVHVPLALGWLRKRFDPRALVVFRHPLNILASMWDLDMPDRDRRLDRSARVKNTYLERWGVSLPNEGASQLERAAWQIGLLQSTLAEEASKGDAVAVVHEDLCVDTAQRFRSLFEQLSLPWSEDVDAYITRSNRPGSGYKTNRVTAELPQRWRRRLGRDEVERVRTVLAPFPMPGWPRDRSDP